MTTETMAPTPAPLTTRSTMLGVLLFAVGMFVWAAGQPLWNDNAVAAWTLFLVGGAFATNGFLLVCGYRGLWGRDAALHAAPLGVALYLLAIRSSGELLDALAVTAGVVVLVAAIARAVIQLRTAQERLATVSLLEDRQRVAADIHDIVGHAMAVTMLHINGARLSLPANPDAAVEALEQAEQSGRQSMNEIRAMVRLLRSDELSELISQADATDLPTLIDGFRTAGADLTVSGTIDDLDLSPLTSVTLYRLVQEGLTNATRHGTGPIELSIVANTDTIDLEIVNPSPPTAAPSVPGHGLNVARERVAAIGGTFEAGPVGSVGTWRVAARLPR